MNNCTSVRNFSGGVSFQKLGFYEGLGFCEPT